MILSVVAAQVGKYLGLAALGAGVVLGVNYCRDKSARDAIEAKPAILANAQAIDTATKTQVLTSTKHRSAVSGFQSYAGTVRSDPQSSPQLLACIDRGAEIISTCHAQHVADTNLIALYRDRAELMEAEAVRARRGKLLSLSGAIGYDWMRGAPAGRLSAGVNFSDNWSITATFDQAAKIKRDSTGKIKTEWLPSSFVGLQYHFGGRH